MLRTRIWLVAVAVVAVGGCTDPVRVTAPLPTSQQVRNTPWKPYLRSDGTVVAPNDTGFVEEARRQIQGKVLANNGCEVSDSGHLTPGEHRAERVAEINPSTCLVTMAVGHRIRPHAAHAAAAPTAVISATASRFPTANSAVNVRPLDQYYSSEAESYMWFQDPVALHVAEDDVYLTWRYDLGVCSTSGQVGHAALPLTASGWILLASTSGQASTHSGSSYCDSYNG